jgi:glycosyltransferase involved in cell wall biosynthesis
MNVIASHRPYSWARAWRDLGHEIEVLTFARHPFDGALDLERDLSGIRVHEVRYLPLGRPAAASAQRVARWESIKTLTRRARFSLGIFGDPRLLAYGPLVRKGLQQCSEQRFDLIVATSPPEIVFLVARTLSRRTGIPWVADFRDLWFRDMLLYRSRIAAWLAGPINRWLVRSAALLVTVSRGLQERLSAYLGREAIVSYNGFYGDAPQSTFPADGRKHIVYTGRLYPGKRDPEPLFRALTQLRAERPDLAQHLSVDFYGFDDPWLRSVVARHSVQDCVTLHGFVPHRQSTCVQCAADELLFLDWTDVNAEGVLTGKLFEYLGARRPILGIGPRNDSEAARVISDTGAGTTLTTHAEIVEHLRSLIASPRPADIPAEAVQEYSRDRQAVRLLEDILRQLRMR